MVMNIKLCPISYKSSRFKKIYNLIILNDLKKIELCLPNRCFYFFQTVIKENRRNNEMCWLA